MGGIFHRTICRTIEFVIEFNRVVCEFREIFELMCVVIEEHKHLL